MPDPSHMVGLAEPRVVPYTQFHYGNHVCDDWNYHPRFTATTHVSILVEGSGNLIHGDDEAHRRHFNSVHRVSVHT